MKEKAEEELVDKAPILEAPPVKKPVEEVAVSLYNKHFTLWNIFPKGGEGSRKQVIWKWTDFVMLGSLSSFEKGEVSFK